METPSKAERERASRGASEVEAIPSAMTAVRLTAPGGPEGLAVERIEVPEPGPGEALVRVHAAAITRGELDWPTDRLPAIPSYELSGVVVALGPGVTGLEIGQAVWGMTPFDRDGVAAEYALVPASVLAPKPAGIPHARCAAVPLPALSAWQGLFEHGGLEPGHRVLVHGAGGGVGRYAVRLARRQGAAVIGTASRSGLEAARAAGADEVRDRTAEGWAAGLEPVELVFDTVGGEALAGSAGLLRPGGRIVSVAGEPPAGAEGLYFVVRPDAEQLAEPGALLEAGDLAPAIDSTYPLAEARAAFERVERPGKSGKVVIEVAGE